MTERNNRYFETSFLPGRTFIDPADFNTQLDEWLVKANGRHSRRIGCAPAQRWSLDRDAMLTLPPTPPVTGWVSRVRLPRDYYVRVASNDYSVDPKVVGRFVEVVADLSTVTVTCSGTVVARHSRCWARHQTITDPGHREAALRIAHTHRSATTRSDLDPTGPGAVRVQQRDLSVYDAAFGLTDTTDGEVA